MSLYPLWVVSLCLLPPGSLLLPLRVDGLFDVLFVSLLEGVWSSPARRPECPGGCGEGYRKWDSPPRRTPILTPETAVQLEFKIVND